MKRALLFVTLLVTSLLSITAPAQAAAPACQTAFANPPGWTQISSTPDTWDQTNGNVIAADFLYTAGGPYIAIGGNFTKVAGVPAVNLAILRLSDGKVMWGASSMSGYPKTLTAHGGLLFVGGSFTQINGVARKAIAVINATTFAIHPWAPVVDGGTIRDIEVSDAGIAYLAGNGSVMAFHTWDTGRAWTAPAAQGVVRTLLMSPDQSGLFVGGDFNKLAGVPVTQLAEIYPISSGKVYTPFAPQLRPNSSATTHDGELVSELAWDAETHLITGTGGAATNSVKSIAPWDGGQFWSNLTEGDTQALGVLGNTTLSGSHRSHGNTNTGCPFSYFGVQWGDHDGTNFVMPWDPGLNNGTAGRSTNQSVASEANGGISEIKVELSTRKVYVLGDFTAYGGTCDYTATTLFYVPCTGTTPLRGIARYSF